MVIQKAHLFKDKANYYFIKSPLTRKSILDILEHTSMAVDITDAQFEGQVLKSDLPVLVDFWAPWCGPCKMVSPIIEELGEEYKGKVKVVKVNVDDNPQYSGQYNVMSIPSIFIFKKGQPVKTMVGAQSKDNFKKVIDEALAS